MGYIAGSVVYYRGFREISLSSTKGSIFKTI